MSTLEMTDRPRTPQHPVIPSAEFRQVLGRFATGVTVMTTRCPQGRVAGVTVSSFNTLSLDPPLVLWSLALNAPSLDVFRAAGRFAVNILAEDQAQLALQFARGAEDKFRGATVSEGLGGVPLIDGAVAHLECVIERRDPGGDHELYIGRTVRTHSSERHPLIYAKGRFGQFTTLS
jgi:flavin reductase (DIM6/NTAB) family NADH-FMN oxidoreductase RutF